MKRIISGRVGIAQGSQVLFSDFADGGAMWTGSGPRESRHKVSFEQAFDQAPVVMVSISMWDMDQKTNVRADISAEKVTKTGFQLVFRTWGDTRVARIRADWTAIGALKDDDLWEVD
ncbi:MAG: hypothetical protein DI533_09170 [Cereibacter sphaeroides]|uniref:H-type lectin domain-containing protein n=1 Tax=Cereibacter sphaeroides TaxID=1063 RepID=A0A2W5SEQ0_CERSP|nr:MAG: hypothetical protein DI533_09170 [Cereibacter sphaeroides]